MKWFKGLAIAMTIIALLFALYGAWVKPGVSPQQDCADKLGKWRSVPPDCVGVPVQGGQ